MVYAALEGAAVGFVMGLSDEEIERGIAAYKTVGRRGVVTDTGFVTLVDDCYNANPNSMAAAIRSLSSIRSLSAKPQGADAPGARRVRAE